MSPQDADRYAVIGHPIAHSRSPAIHRLFAEQTGERVTYETIDAEPAQFESSVRAFRAAGGKGLNVTIPHKEAAFRLADELGSDARRAGAVNTLTFAVADGPVRGDNTDGIGFMRDVTINHGVHLEGRRVLVLGAGGAARGILGPLLDARPCALVIANRDASRAERLVAEFAPRREQVRACGLPALAQTGSFEIVVNATPVSLTGGELPFPPNLIDPASFCYDLAYASHDTPFVAWALARGARRAVQGWGMLVEQAAESFRIWRGVRPDTRGIVAQLARREPRAL